MARGNLILGLIPAGAAADVLQLSPLVRIVNSDNPDKILAGILSFFDERKNVFPREEICEFIDKYKAFDLIKELAQFFNRAMSQILS